MFRPEGIIKGRIGLGEKLRYATPNKMSGEIKAGWENFTTVRAIKHCLAR